jgi:hypothetical protein
MTAAGSAPRADSVNFTEDAGRNWHAANVCGKSAGKLNAVFFTGRRNGWAVGADGKILFVREKSFAVGFGVAILVYGEKDSENRAGARPVLQKRNR